ncbi:MAG TPA: hypothetical protein VHO06_08040, partial [Polyangia bacterium]|nr:hypothetical protein [Polyangia bacterium]
MKTRLCHRLALVAAAGSFLAAGPARAEQPASSVTAAVAPASTDVTTPATDAIPGSPTPPGLGLAPEAPPVSPAPGGRAPSFGAPSTEPTSSFRIGGR